MAVSLRIKTKPATLKSPAPISTQVEVPSTPPPIAPTVAIEPSAAAPLPPVAISRAEENSPEVLRLQRVAGELLETLERVEKSGRDVAHLREAAKVFLTGDSMPYRMPHDPKFRPFSPLSTDNLRLVARTNDVSARCISHLISEVVKVPLKVAPKDPKDTSPATKRAIEEATNWLSEDGGLGGFGVRRAVFEAQMVRDVLEIGALALHFEFDTAGHRLDGKPSQVRALDSATIQPLVDAHGFPVGEDGFAFTQWVMGVQTAKFSREEIIYEGLPSFARSDSPYFMSPTEYAVVQIYTLMRVDEWNRTWLTDGSGYQQWLKLNESVTPDQAKEWIEIMNLQTTGNAKERHKIGLAPGDITGDHSRKDQDFDTFEHSRMDRICSCYGVNPASIGQHSRQYKDSQQAAMDSTREGIVAEILLLREQLYNRIFRRMGWDSIEATEDVPPPTEAPQERVVRQNAQIAGGNKTVNQIRAENGDEPVEGGDELLLPATLKPISQVMAPPPEPEVPGADGSMDNESLSADKPNTGANTGAKAPNTGVDSGKAPDEDDKTERAETSVEVARGFDYSCVMAMLAPQAAGRVRKFARELISADDLTEEGFDDEPHITLLYGLHTADTTDVADVLCPWSNFRACVKGISIFSTDKYDVVKLDMDGHDGDLDSINSRLRELEYTNDYDEFKPHLTLAYVKPGEGAKYAGKKFPFWEGGTADSGWLKFDGVRFSSKDGTQRDIDLRSGHEKAVERALGQWERKSLKRLERGQSAACAFESKILGDAQCNTILSQLHLAREKTDVRAVFRSDNASHHGYDDSKHPRGGDPEHPGRWSDVSGAGSSSSSGNFWGGDDRDEVTKQHFNGKLTVTGADDPSVLSASQKLFGRELSADDWKELAAAPDGHNVKVKADRNSIQISIEKGEFFKKLVISNVHPGDGEVTKKKAFLELDALFTTQDAPERLAPRMLSYIFSKCDELGIDTVSLEAAGYKGHSQGYTGYSRWPQLGFDSDLLEREQESLPPQFAGGKTVRDIMDKEGGFDWWVEKGRGRRMEFRTPSGSRSQKVFQAYLDDRGIKTQ